MNNRITVPALGESVVEARIDKWLKKEGDHVKTGDILVELETEKVNVEVAAQADGVLARIAVPEEATVHIGDTIGEIESGQAVSPEISSGTSARPVSIMETTAEGSRPPVESKESAFDQKIREKATPVAKRVAEDIGLSVSEISGSGTGGRVTKQDVEAFLKTREQEIGHGNGNDVGGLTPAHVSIGSRREERVRMTLRRKTIARRMVEAQQTAAMLTTFNEIDMSVLMALREKYKGRFKEKYNINLGIVSFFTRAVIGALKEFPRLNAVIDGDEIVYKYYYDIGIAIGAEEGLVVPVIRNAEALSLAETEIAIRDFVEKSLRGTLTLEDLKGGTFTITNGGVFGSMMSTPILNPPQVGILGLHKITDRAVAVEISGEKRVVVRPMMYVALTYDHRIVDGRESVQFLAKVKQFIEDPASMLLE